MSGGCGEEAEVLTEAYDVRKVVTSPRLVAGVRAQVPRGLVSQHFGRQVYAAAQNGALHLDGQNIFIYREATATELTVDFCVGATGPFSAIGAVRPLQTPAGAAAC